jgi:hypothetical protein
MKLLQLGRIRKSGLELPLSKFYFFDNTRLKCSCFHKLDKSSDCAWFFIRLQSLLTFGCDGWDFKLHWAKSDTKLGFNSPSKCVCVLFLGFKFCNNVTSCLCFSFPFNKGATFWTRFFGGCQLDLKKLIGATLTYLKKK